MTEVSVIVMSPVTSTNYTQGAPIEADCGHLCWVSPVSLEVIQDPTQPTRTVCTTCAALDGTLEKMAEQGIVALPGQRAEIASVIGEAETDVAFKRLGVTEF